MNGYTMISNEEYKSLIFAEKDAEVYKKAFEAVSNEKKWLTKEFNELLLMITEGNTTVQWSDKQFSVCDVATSNVIAEYINNKYFVDGKLILKENDR